MFKSPLSLVSLDSRPDEWYLGAPLIWDNIIVPAGFITDLATIPHIVDALPDLDRTGRSRRPGALHDWLYAGLRVLTKPVADGILLQALLAEGMDSVGAKIIYEAVHLLADTAWEDDGRKAMSANFITHEAYLAWLATSPVLNPAE